MRRADRVIADAAAAVIAARITTALQELPLELPGEQRGEIAAATAQAAVDDLTDAGWYITPLPQECSSRYAAGPWRYLAVLLPVLALIAGVCVWGGPQ